MVFFFLSYFSLLLLSSILLLIFPYLKIWFLTDIQNLRISLLVNSLIIFLLSSAGIPPFWGFFCKIISVSYLFSVNNLYLGCWVLIGGYTSAYFYWQLIRFISLKNYYFTTLKIVQNLPIKFLFIIFVLLTINIFTIFFIQDLFIFSTLVFFV